MSRFHVLMRLPASPGGGVVALVMETASQTSKFSDRADAAASG